MEAPQSIDTAAADTEAAAGQPAPPLQKMDIPEGLDIPGLKVETLEETEGRIEKGTIKHAIFEVRVCLSGTSASASICKAGVSVVMPFAHQLGMLTNTDAPVQG